MEGTATGVADKVYVVEFDMVFSAERDRVAVGQ
jgi:hypothetical protein